MHQLPADLLSLDDQSEQSETVDEGEIQQSEFAADSFDPFALESEMNKQQEDHPDFNSSCIA